MKTKNYTKATIAGWDEAAPIHARHNMSRYVKQFSKPGFVIFDKQEADELHEVGIRKKDIAHICCNNGRELVSLKNMGANRCVGFDGSASFIEQANQINDVAKTDCEFVCTDIYDIDEQFNDQFDLIYISVGVFGWMPDIDRFFAIISGLLRRGGLVYILEQHPILDMIEPGAADSPVAWNYSYFSSEPFVEKDGLDYYGNESYEAKPIYSFHHKLSDIFTAAIKHKLYIDTFEELPDHISNCWYNVEAYQPQLPMSYLLILLKE